MEESATPFHSARREALFDTHSVGFSVHSFRKKCVDFHWHFHPELELTYIEKGDGIRHVGRSIMPYAPGDLCLIGSNLPHAYASRPDQRQGAKWTVLHFLPKIWGEEFWALPQNRPLSDLFRQAGRGIQFSGDEVATCFSLMERLQARHKEDFTMPLLLEILERLARNVRRRVLNPTTILQEEGLRIDPRLQKTLAWLDENFRQLELSQAEVAGRIGMTPQAFCRFFRQNTGRTFRRYINELRVADVCANLKAGDTSVSEAAYGAGFGNIANFNRRFREILGQTPSAYRE